MKKLVFIASLWAALLLLLNTQLNAQQLYASLGAGYNLPMATQNINQYGLYNYTRFEDGYREERVNISFGQGFNVQGSIGYLFNRNFGLELGASYLFSSTSKISENYEATSFDPTPLRIDFETSAQMFRLIPTLVLKNEFRNYSLYSKFGVVAGFGDIIFEREIQNGNEQAIIHQKLDGGLAWGLSLALGATYAVNEKLDLFAELKLISMSYAPSKGLVTKYIVNDVDELPFLTTEEKEVEFVDEFSIDYNDPSPSDEPTKALKHSLPFSSIGLNIGLSYKF